MEPLLEWQGLGLWYEKNRPALEDVSITLHAGERVAVLGANGAGKSTFFLCCNGVLQPQRGKLFYKGQPVDLEKSQEKRQLRRRVGIVFQEADEQIIGSTVRGEVSFGPLNLGLSHGEAAQATDAALAVMGLQELAQRAPQYLSGGEKKRVTIADVLAMEPQLILLDEPAASLDPAGAQSLENTLADLSRRGMGLVVSTHDVDFAYRWAQRCLVFCQGKLIAQGDPQEIFEQEDLLQRASLRQPLLYRVAKALGIPKEEGWPRSIEEFEQRAGELQ